VNVPVLIDAIVRQVTVLLAQLATAGGVRAPLAHIANQVFVELANELAAQGVSRKVGADMFGMALRAYVRKVRRLNESSTEHGVTLWKAVLEYLGETPRSRDEYFRAFIGDADARGDRRGRRRAVSRRSSSAARACYGGCARSGTHGFFE
jgi:hypothetical protein